MILTDEELRTAWAKAWGITSPLREPESREASAMRAVERAVIDKLIAEHDQVDRGRTTVDFDLAMAHFIDWLRSKQGAE